MKVIGFLSAQLIGIVILYAVHGYVFTEFEGLKAWSVFLFLVAFYLAYAVRDLLELIEFKRKLKNFKW